MKIFIHYSASDFENIEKIAGLVGVPSLVTRGIAKLGNKPVAPVCPGKCDKIIRHYTVTDEVAENLQRMADNEGVSVSLLVQKKVIQPLIVNAVIVCATTTVPCGCY